MFKTLFRLHNANGIVKLIIMNIKQFDMFMKLQCVICTIVVNLQ